MTFRDLLVMSINNLRRRKLRTVLTVLGVVIGTASIVVMVSLGIGLNEMTVEQISSYGSLTTIEVSSPNRWGGSSENSDPNYITADVVNMLKRLPHVKGVSPVLSVQVLMRQGAYQAYASLSGVSDDYLNEIPVGEGERPSSRDKELRMLVGNQMITQFSNAKTGKGYWDTGEVPDVDFMNQPVFVIFDMDAYYQSQAPADAE